MNAHFDPPSLAESVGDMMEGLMLWREEIEQALHHAEYSHKFDDIAAMVLQQHLTLYTFDDCFCLCQINVFPQFKALHFMIAGGNLDGIISRKAHFEELAKGAGCKYMSFSGRKGWERALKQHGWRHKFTTMWSEIEQ